MPRPQGFVLPQEHKDKIRKDALRRNQLAREYAPIREAIDAGDERLAIRLVRELLRGRKQEAA